MYRKTIEITSINSSTCTKIAHNIENIDKFIEINGGLYLSYNGGALTYFPITSNHGSTDDYNLMVWSDLENVEIYMGSYLRFIDNSYGYLNIEYTKTTDAPVNN